MTRIVELSTGHVFDADSVRAVEPVKPYRYFCQKTGAYLNDGLCFDVVGIGYRVTIQRSWPKEENADRSAYREAEQAFRCVHAEAVSKLLPCEGST